MLGPFFSSHLCSPFCPFPVGWYERTMASCLTFPCFSSSVRIHTSCWAIWRSPASLWGKSLLERGYWMINIQICSWSPWTKDPDHWPRQWVQLHLSRKLRLMLEKLTPLLPWGLIEGLPWVWRLLSFGVSYEDTLATTSVCELPVVAVPSHLGGGTCRQVPEKMALSSLQMSAPGCPTKCLLHRTPATWSPKKRRSLSGFPP